MGAVYLAALIFGLGVLLLQFVVPAGHADGGHTPELGGDAGPDAGATGGHAGGQAGAIAAFLSLRFWTFGLMAFGFVGTLLHFLHLSGMLTAIVTAGSVGLASGFLASFTMRAVARAQTSSGGEVGEAVGQVGRVLLAIERGRLGKIRVEVHGRLLDLLATTDGQRLESGESVIVEEMRGATAHVSHADDALAPKSLIAGGTPNPRRSRRD